MTRVEYDPRQLADVMAMLERSSSLQEGSGRVPQWLSTHPDPANRVDHIQTLVRGLNADLSTWSVRREPYLRSIDGIVFGNDPREGFFEDDVFYHPQLRFRVSLPEGWQHVNTKQAVQSVAPDQDAAILLTLADGSPEQALGDFAAQQGVQVRNTSRDPVNGLPAAGGAFSAATEQGTLTGAVVFLSHGGDTYRILGYAPESRWSSYASAVRASLSSFGPEDSPRVLSVEPARVDLVALDRSLAFNTFNERYPSTVRSEIVALINQVDTTSELPAGLLAKRVVGGR
jgi:predicted Zn-dependent protease